MGRPLVSVVLATFNRVHLLKRSLECYARQDFDNKDFELVVVDDNSTDGTYLEVEDWSDRTGIRCTILSPFPKKEKWRDCGAVLNYGIRASQGKHVLLTHPEVMPGRRSVKSCVEVLEDWENSHKTQRAFGRAVGLYACCKVYYLSRQDQTRIDSVPWQNEGVPSLRQIAGFYSDDTNGNPDYRHDVTDRVATPGFRIPVWQSWVFGGCSRQTWKTLGGMIETSKWGSVDVAFVARRTALGIGNHTCPSDDTICAHQNHDGPGDVQTPRDEASWRNELKDFPKRPTDLVYPAVDNLGWD